MMAATEELHPAERYIRDVMSGKIVVGKWVKTAVERHVRDLEHGGARGLFFDRKAADRAIRFFGLLRHSKGEWSGKRFELNGWQQFILWCVFGWKKADGTRRFRMAYVKIARKNGKSTFAAGVGLYLFCADNEEGSEVYAAATKREQSRIVHDEATAMVRRSPSLRCRVNIFRDSLSIPEKRARFVPLGAKAMDGQSPSGAIIDELHEHPNRKCLDALDSGTGARRQPLLFIITTAGSGKTGVDQDTHNYAEKILGNIIEDDSFFAIMYTIDPEDDWKDERVWAKANPNLGISVKVDDLRAKCRKAIEMPTAQNEFLRKHMNRQMEQVTRFISMDKWKACTSKIPDVALAGRRCFAGMDLSSKLDLSAVAFVFPPTDEDRIWRVKVELFVPEDRAAIREREANVPYQTWGSKGFINLTPGNVIDYEFIKQKIRDRGQLFSTEELGFDPWNAMQIAIQLGEEGLKTVEVGQGYRSLSEPTKELEKLITSGKFAHDGNPVLDWMASNVAIETDPAGNIKPSKKNSSEKIDGIAAIVTAMARALVASSEVAYSDERDLLTI